MIRVLKNLFGKSEPAPKPAGNWPFDQPETCAVITTTHVLKEGRDITRVSHDLDDHGWQFHHGDEVKPEDAMVVLLKNIVAHDPSVLEVADMPPGWTAIRTRRGEPWRKARNG